MPLIAQIRYVIVFNTLRAAAWTAHDAGNVWADEIHRLRILAMTLSTLEADVESALGTCFPAAPQFIVRDGSTTSRKVT